MDWNDLVNNAKSYGFLGPIVGIAGLLIGAGAAILFGWTHSFDKWKPPPDVLPDALGRTVSALCAIAIFFGFLLAEPANQAFFVRAVAILTTVGVVAFLSYVFLYQYCGRFTKPSVGADNQPGQSIPVWGGFWLTPKAKAAVADGSTVPEFFAGNYYSKDATWPPGSQALAATVTALVVLAALVCLTGALSTSAATLQVALTGKPARAIVTPSDIPGMRPGA